MSNLASAFHQYLVAQGIPIEGVSFNVDPPAVPEADVTIRFASNATQDQITAGNGYIATFDWTKSYTVEPGQAIVDIQSDLTLSDDIQMNLLSFLGVLNTYVKNANGVKKSWQLMIGAYGSGWLTSDVQAKIQKHCADNGCPLVW